MVISKRIVLVAVFLACLAVQAGEQPGNKAFNKWTKEQLLMSREDALNDVRNRYSCVPLYDSENKVRECVTEIPSFKLSEPFQYIAQDKLYKKLGIKGNVDTVYEMNEERGPTFQELVAKTIQALPVEVDTNEEMEDVALKVGLDFVQRKQGELKKFGQSLNHAYTNALELLAQCHKKNNYLPSEGQCELQAEFLDDVKEDMGEATKVDRFLGSRYRDLNNAFKKRRFELEKDMITKHKLRKELIRNTEEEDRKWREFNLRQELGE